MTTCIKGTKSLEKSHGCYILKESKYNQEWSLSRTLFKDLKNSLLGKVKEEDCWTPLLQLSSTTH